MNNLLRNLRNLLSEEWQKPKEKNAKGKEPRDYKRIAALHEAINNAKK